MLALRVRNLERWMLRQNRRGLLPFRETPGRSTAATTSYLKKKKEIPPNPTKLGLQVYGVAGARARTRLWLLKTRRFVLDCNNISKNISTSHLLLQSEQICRDRNSLAHLLSLTQSLVEGKRNKEETDARDRQITLHYLLLLRKSLLQILIRR